MTDAPRNPPPNLDMGDPEAPRKSFTAFMRRIMALGKGRWVIILDTRHERLTWAINEMGKTEHA